MDAKTERKIEIVATVVCAALITLVLAYFKSVK